APIPPPRIAPRTGSPASAFVDIATMPIAVARVAITRGLFSICLSYRAREFGASGDRTRQATSGAHSLQTLTITDGTDGRNRPTAGGAAFLREPWGFPAETVAALDENRRMSPSPQIALAFALGIAACAGAARAETKTICTVTVNSSDEREAFRQ